MQAGTKAPYTWNQSIYSKFSFASVDKKNVFFYIIYFILAHFIFKFFLKLV